MNAFQTFSLTPALTLDLDALREVYQDLAAKNHPDSGGDQAEFETINLHYKQLLSPASRLKIYLECKGIEHDPRGSVSNELMDLFMQVGALLQQTDSFLRKKESASSALAKALLEAESMEAQENLSALIARIESYLESLTNSFSQNLADDSLPQLARDLTFLEKWQAQLQQRYGALF